MDWKENFLVGVPELDQQHKALVQCITDIESSAASVDSGTPLFLSLEKFVSLLGTHFSSEERLMRTFKYPDVVAHTEEHHELLQDLMETDLNAFPAPQARALAEYLGKWLENHFADDKEYAAYFSSILNKKIGDL